MTSTSNQLLKFGILYYGYVMDIKCATASQPYQGVMTYQHKVFIQFDQFPNNVIECAYMNDQINSELFMIGEYVRITAKNFNKNNYSIQKDLTFIAEKQELENASFLYPKNATPAGLDLVSYMMNTSVMGAAMFCQYRPNCTEKDFKNLVLDIYVMMKLKQEMQ